MKSFEIIHSVVVIYKWNECFRIPNRTGSQITTGRPWVRLWRKGRGCWLLIRVCTNVRVSLGAKRDAGGRWMSFLFSRVDFPTYNEEPWILTRFLFLVLGNEPYWIGKQSLSSETNSLNSWMLLTSVIWWVFFQKLGGGDSWGVFFDLPGCSYILLGKPKSE